jgi:hypothetical protein
VHTISEWHPADIAIANNAVIQPNLFIAECLQLHLTNNNVTVPATIEPILAVFAGGSMRFCGFLPLYTVRYCI